MLPNNIIPEGADLFSAKKATEWSLVKRPFVAGYEGIDPTKPVTIFTDLAEGLSIVTQNNSVFTIPSGLIEWKYDD